MRWEIQKRDETWKIESRGLTNHKKKRKRRRRRELLEEVMAENFPELLKDINPQIWGSHKKWGKGEEEWRRGRGGRGEGRGGCRERHTVGRTEYHI